MKFSNYQTLLWFDGPQVVLFEKEGTIYPAVHGEEEAFMMYGGLVRPGTWKKFRAGQIDWKMMMERAYRYLKINLDLDDPETQEATREEVVDLVSTGLYAKDLEFKRDG